MAIQEVGARVDTRQNNVIVVVHPTRAALRATVSAIITLRVLENTALRANQRSAALRANQRNAALRANQRNEALRANQRNEALKVKSIALRALDIKAPKNQKSAQNTIFLIVNRIKVRVAR